MKKIFIALIILGGVFTMANAQILGVVESKEGYNSVVEIEDAWYKKVSKAIPLEVYTEYLDIYFNGNVYTAVPILEFIDNESGFHTNTVFELDGHKIKTKHPVYNEAVCGIYIDDKDYYKIDIPTWFRFYSYNERDDSYGCSGGVSKINKQKIGKKTYELLVGNFFYPDIGERLWVREISE